jgi:CDP-diacylglycerol pyrophosphatase
VSDFVVYLSFKCADVAELIEAIDAQVATEWLPIPIKLNDVGRFSKWSARLITDARLQARLWA